MNAWRQHRRAVLLRQTSDTGFTLIEIMVVIGILAMVLAMGLPSFVRTVRKDPLRQAASDIWEGCIEARAQAILTGYTAQLVIEASTGQILVVPGTAASSTEGADPARSVPQELAGKRPFQATMDMDVAIRLVDVNLKDQMGADQVRVRFYPNGTSDDFTIILESAAGMREISLDCITGLPDLTVHQ